MELISVLMFMHVLTVNTIVDFDSLLSWFFVYTHRELMKIPECKHGDKNVVIQIFFDIFTTRCEMDCAKSNTNSLVIIIITPNIKKQSFCKGWKALCLSQLPTNASWMKSGISMEDCNYYRLQAGTITMRVSTQL